MRDLEGEWSHCLFLQLQALHFDTDLLFPQADEDELRQNWKRIINYLTESPSLRETIPSKPKQTRC